MTGAGTVELALDGGDQLPTGWAWARLRDLGVWYGGGTPSKRRPEFWEDGTVPWLSPKDMGADTIASTQDLIHSSALDASPVKRVPANSVALVVRSGILERKVPIALVPFATTLNQDMKAVSPFDGIDARWLAWALRAREDYILANCRKRGTTVASLEVPWLMDMMLPVPPTAEQARIVAKLDEYVARIDAGEASTRVALATSLLLAEQIAGQGALGGFVSASDLTAHPLANAGVSDGDLPDLPSDWSWVRLGEISEVVGGVTKDSKKQGDPSFVEVPYLRVANVQRGALKLDTVTTIRVPPAKAEALRLQAGDVLLNEGGDRDKLGRGWIWEGQIADCIHQNHVFRARIRNERLHPKLLAWHANSFGKAWCDRNGSQVVNLASISLRKIKLLPVPLPPKDIQENLVKEIEVRLATAAAGEQLARDGFVRAVELRSSLLATALAGQLVPQDPTDEPAATVLARIGAAQSAAAAAKSKRTLRPRKSTAPDQGEFPL
ncbi:restriction endonuclease subunit S [Streptomyces sp. BE20]|uniref:restriction endonuclease subunit S n=1 Tax=unclassified Streptomyces TaxID=2593676 RepID=UPI002E7A9083|nr:MULTISPECIES: restriction endonuclease subunit S [unclassified Streptomyces]MED7950367.1 restriction endonuclease subunit S [Streptomyces sp. BE303]MEE1826618.1 restriction endonuclease subunit S [Streptomyces sp. BE20]